MEKIIVFNQKNILILEKIVKEEPFLFIPTTNEELKELLHFEHVGLVEALYQKTIIEIGKPVVYGEKPKYKATIFAISLIPVIDDMKKFLLS